MVYMFLRHAVLLRISGIWKNEEMLKLFCVFSKLRTVREIQEDLCNKKIKFELVFLNAGILFHKY